MMLAHVTGLKPGIFVHTFGDVHLYKNHIAQAKEQLTRTPKKLPTMKLPPDRRDLFSFKIEDFVLENYDTEPHIKAEVSV